MATGNGAAATAAKPDAFDAFVGSQSGGDNAGAGDGVDVADATGATSGLGDGGRGSYGSMFGDEVAAGVDPVTGREMDGPGGKEAVAEGEEPPVEGTEGEEAQPDADLIHGMKPDALLEAIKSGRVPDELLAHLRIKQRINGEDVEVTLADARENGMRLNDYTRAHAALKTDRGEHKQAVDNFVTMLKSWKDTTPQGRQQTRMLWEEWAGEETVLEIARDIADEHVRLEKMGPEGREAFLEARRVKRELARERQRAQQLTQSGKKREQSDASKAFVAKVGKWRDDTFKELGIRLNKNTGEMFANHLKGAWDRTTPISVEHVKEAARALKQDLDDAVADIRKAELTKAQANPKLAAKPAPSGGGKPGAKRVAPKLDNFDDFLAGRG